MRLIKLSVAGVSTLFWLSHLPGNTNLRELEALSSLWKGFVRAKPR